MKYFTDHDEKLMISEYLAMRISIEHARCRWFIIIHFSMMMILIFKILHEMTIMNTSSDENRKNVNV